MFNASTTRYVLSRLPDTAAQEDLRPPELSRLYVPSGHQKALGLDAAIVVGMRGAGKSLWTAVLSSDEHRAYVAEVAGLTKLGELQVKVGFGLDDTNRHFPNERVLATLLRDGHDPLHIWQAVVLRHAVKASKQQLPFSNEWGPAVKWIAKFQEKADLLLSTCDRELEERGAFLLVVFDALDRLSSDWERVRILLIAALRFSLQCRSKKAIKLKFFLRPDMEEDSEIWRFPDSSKLRHSKVELDWRTADLYGLILLHIANSKEYGSEFRRIVGMRLGIRWEERQGVFPIPRDLVIVESNVRTVIEEVAGKWVGRSAKRGFTYTWIPTHLADAAGRVSPRSFLLTFKRAAEYTEDHYPQFPHALHFEAIQHGVAHASQIRIEEIKEDYPWVDPLLQAARGLTVPCDAKELIRSWTSAQLKEVRNAAKKLPPRRFSVDPTRQGRPEALIADLAELAVVYETEDGRINIPDIFRVGFGIRRKGGVRPPR